MYKSIANIKDFKNLEYTQRLYFFSSTGEKTNSPSEHELIMITTPILGTVKYKVLLNKTVLDTYIILEDAIAAYNKL